MARSFNELKKKMSPQARKQVKTMMSEMPLYELRQALALSQEQLAESLNVKQPAVSKIEHSADMYVSTLSRFVKAMGGSLEVVAHFPEGDVRINQFKELHQRCNG